MGVKQYVTITDVLYMTNNPNKDDNMTNLPPEQSLVWHVLSFLASSWLSDLVLPFVSAAFSAP